MDIGRALTYFSEDERWVEKTAIGTGLLLISSLLLVALIGVLGYFILFGYLVRLLQNVRDDVHPVLPEWDRWGDDLVRGVKLVCVYLVWALPIILVSVPMFIIGVIVSENFRYVDDDIGAIFILCSLCLQFLVGIAFLVFQPGFTVAFARNETISEGLQVSEIWDWTRDNIGNVAIVAILTVIAGMIITTVGSIVGLILCVIGAVVTVPLSQLVIYYFQSHLYGQLARQAGEGEGGSSTGPVPAPGPEFEWTAETEDLSEISAEVIPPTVFDPQAEPEASEDPEVMVEAEMTDEGEPQADSAGPEEAEGQPEEADQQEGNNQLEEDDQSEGGVRSDEDEPPSGPKSQ